MLFRGKPLHDLTKKEFISALNRNRRLGEVARRFPPNHQAFKNWDRKARALLAEGKRRGLVVYREGESNGTQAQAHA